MRKLRGKEEPVPEPLLVGESDEEHSLAAHV
jgi:hypothetical protein